MTQALRDQTLSQDLIRLLQSEERYDVIVTAIGAKNRKFYKLHSLILWTRSPRFVEELLRSPNNSQEELSVTTKLSRNLTLKRRGGKEERNSVQDLTAELKIEPVLLEVLLNYVYGGILEAHKLDPAESFTVLKYGITYELFELVHLLESYLINARPEYIKRNYAKANSLSTEYQQLTNLQEFCQRILQAEPEFVFESSDFAELPEETLIQLLRVNTISLSEINIFEKVLQWGREQINRERNLKEINRERNLKEINRERNLKRDPELKPDPKRWRGSDFDELRLKLKNCLPLIRFFDISSADFSRRVLPYRSILSDSLFTEIMEFHLRPGYVLPNSQPRNRPMTDSLITEHQTQWILRNIDSTGVWRLSINISAFDVQRSRHKLRRIFRASNDGFTATDFHNKCNGKGPTVVVIQIEGTNQLVGGYNPKEWRSPRGGAGQQENAEKSFIFSLGSDAYLRNAVLSKVKQGKCALFHSETAGPCFGVCDLSMTKDGQGGYKWQSARRCYETAIIDGADRGVVEFQIEDYEVYKVENN